MLFALLPFVVSLLSLLTYYCCLWYCFYWSCSPFWNQLLHCAAGSNFTFAFIYTCWCYVHDIITSTCWNITIITIWFYFFYHYTLKLHQSYWKWPKYGTPVYHNITFCLNNDLVWVEMWVKQRNGTFHSRFKQD